MSPPYRSIGTATIPNAPRADDLHVITDEYFIRCTVWRDEWPGHQNLVIELTNPRYTEALSTLHTDTYTSLAIAYARATCRNPFERTRNRHDTPTLRRNSNDPNLTPPAATALETIAAHADVRVVDQHDLDDALLTNEDINLEEVESATGVRSKPCVTLYPYS